MARYNRFMGEYDPSTEYQRGDVVTFEGSAWYRKTAGKGISPIAVKKPYMVWSRMNDDISTIFPLGGVGGGSGSTGGGSLAQTYTDMTPGYVNITTGAFGTGGNWQRTDYIPVSSGDVVTFSGRIGDNMGVAGYDENKAFVASVLDRIDEGSANTYANEPLTIPEGVAYIAGCTNSPSNPITVMVYKDAKVLTGTVLPQNPGAYMQLVTDGEGKWVAESVVGKVLAGQTVYPTYDSEGVVAGEGATIFGDIRERTYNEYGTLQQGNMAIGEYALAEGQATTASGANAHAEGDKTTASGYASHAEGTRTVASLNNSHAEGLNTTASGYYAHAEGNATTASGTAAHTEGDNTKASNQYAHAEGNNTTASGDASHAEGRGTEASGVASHAEGMNTKATSHYAHAEGFYTTASGTYSHAEGQNAISSGDRSHAEGSYTTASGDHSHAEGSNTIASGDNSHAEGERTTAGGLASHAEGYYTTANSAYLNVTGTFNLVPVLCWSTSCFELERFAKIIYA